ESPSIVGSERSARPRCSLGCGPSLARALVFDATSNPLDSLLRVIRVGSAVVEQECAIGGGLVLRRDVTREETGFDTLGDDFLRLFDERVDHLIFGNHAH